MPFDKLRNKKNVLLPQIDLLKFGQIFKSVIRQVLQVVSGQPQRDQLGVGQRRKSPERVAGEVERLETGKFRQHLVRKLGEHIVRQIQVLKLGGVLEQVSRKVQHFR